MVTDLVIVGESTGIEEAIRLMVDKRLKRLPVVDADGRFRGMISRDALLKTA
jgi:CBS domain-containing protein